MANAFAIAFSLTPKAQVQSMSNQIVQRENESGSLRLLLTKRHLYSRAKNYLTLQILLVVAAPGLLVLVQQWRPEYRVWVALYGLVVAIVDIAAFEFLKNRLKRRAAAVQEKFDCYVLALPWSDLKGGPKPDPEDILELSNSDQTLSEIRNWYAEDVAQVAEPTGRIICQRSNCWWDTNLRRTYCFSVVGAAGFIVIAITIAALIQDRTLSEYILGYLAPALPIILWAIREYRSQKEAAEHSERLKGFGDALWNRALNKALTDDEALSQSRDLQDEILARRRQSPLVFDWFYNLLRSAFERKMVASVADMVIEAKKNGA